MFGQWVGIQLLIWVRCFSDLLAECLSKHLGCTRFVLLFLL